MDEVQWKACSAVRLDQPNSQPDSQDAICLLSIFDQVDHFKQGDLTKRQLGALADAPGIGQRVAAISQRFVSNFDRVSHQIEPRSFPVANSIVGMFSLTETRVLSKLDLDNIVSNTHE
ncbi:MAG: hypothetical protein P4L53_17550 [Candidatus Obscuribacterales bacterium]|nr:hypothetical protein [Candidatus Obscuribacterales bacterium]